MRDSLFSFFFFFFSNHEENETMLGSNQRLCEKNVYSGEALKGCVIIQHQLTIHSEARSLSLFPFSIILLYCCDS